jgi:hypothetical protein
MRAYKSHYEIPPAPYRVGQRLLIGDKVYTVIGSTHTHTQFEGMKYAVANWVITQLKKGLGGKDLALPPDVDIAYFPFLRKITDSPNKSTGYDISESSERSTRGTRKKSSKGRNPTGCDLQFFLGASHHLRLTTMLFFNFLGNKESLGELSWRIG